MTGCESLRLLPDRGQTVTIENETLSVAISTRGAELQSIVHRSTGTELLWHGDPKFWSDRSPLMFPVNVRFKDERFTCRGTEYEMPRMGLAIDAPFEVVPASSANEVMFRLDSSDETLRHYPFAFRLEYRYRLDGARLINEITVHNTGSETMHYALGGHPGFACPFEDGRGRGDYRIVFSRKLNVSRPEIIDSLLQDRRIPYLESEDFLSLDDARIPDGGMFLKSAPARRIGVARRDGPPYVTVDLGDFPNVNIWTPPGSPYVCIEPMVSHHDVQESSLAIEEKAHLVTLAPGRAKTYRYTITVNGKGLAVF